MSNGRELLARQVVSPSNNYAEAAQGLAAAFLAGRKTPEEVQLEAAKNALAQQTVFDAQKKASDEIMKQNAITALGGAFTQTEPSLYAPDASGGVQTVHDALTTPEGAKFLTNRAIQYLSAGGKTSELNDINRTFGSYNALVPDGGMTDDVILRLAGSPAMGVNDSISPEGQDRIANRNNDLEITKTNSTKNQKDRIENEYYGTLAAGGTPDANTTRAFEAIHGGDAGKLPTGFQWADPSNPRAGVVPIPGGPAARKTTEEGAKTAGIASSLENIATYKSIMIDPLTGNFDTGKLLAANTQIPFTGSQGVPFTEGRQANNALDAALNTKFRIDTGASANATEEPRLENLFKPSVFDSEETRKQKLQNLERVMSGALKFVDPNNPMLLLDTETGLILDTTGSKIMKSTPQGTTTPMENVAAGGKVFPAEAAAALPPELAPTLPPASPAVELNGKVYIQQNGQWIEQ